MYHKMTVREIEQMLDKPYLSDEMRDYMKRLLEVKKRSQGARPRPAYSMKDWLQVPE